jgi:hypothetical protein
MFLLAKEKVVVYILKYEGERRCLEKSKGEKRGEILQQKAL